MGLIQNKVKVSQPVSHIIIEQAGGLKGETGAQGVPGQAATISVGDTTTLPAGADATVTNTGTTSDAVFNFGIPKGDKGDTGSQGPAGQDGADGFSPTATVTKTGDTATITITDKDGTTTAEVSDGTITTIDDAMSTTSENPVQNKVITNALAVKSDKPIIVSTLPATGTTGQEYLVDDRYNTVTELKGDTEQTSYSGKNLFDYVTMANGTHTGNSTVSVAEDGTITITGNDSANGFVRFTSSTLSGLAPKLVVGQTYYLYLVGTDLQQNYMYIYGDGVQWQNGTTHTVTQTDLNNQIVFYGGYNRTTTFKIMITTTLDTNFEPYVGGTASPNPDYPQEVKTVTGEQTITISDGQGQSQNYPVNLGKNLFDKDNANTDGLFVNGETMKLARNTNVTSIWIPCFGGETYTIQKLNTGTNQRFRVWTTADSPAEWVDVLSVNATDGTYDNDASYTVTTPSNAHYLGVLISVQSTTPSVSDIENSIQIEKGSQATSYSAYFTPIELCKIGTYQDYIYKSGDDWYVHKETGKHIVVANEPSMAWDNVRRRLTFLPTGWDIVPTASSGDVVKAVSNMFVAGSTEYVATLLNDGMCLSTGGYISLRYGVWTSQANALAQAVGAVIYYALATSTDTQITNAALITQLEALATAKIMVDGGTATVTSPNLPALLTTAYSSDSGYIDYIYDGTNFVKVR